MSKKILILSSAESQDNLRILTKYVENLNQAGEGIFECRSASYSDIAIQLGEAIQVVLLSTNEDISEYDFVYFKSFLRNTEEAASLALILKQIGIPFVCSELLESLSISKISQYTKLSLAKIPIPKTVLMDITNKIAYSYLSTSLGLPFVCKAADGKGGEANYLVKDSISFEELVGKHAGQKFVSQSFIPNEGDVRVVVLDNSVKLIIGRKRKDDTTHLNNTSQGGEATLMSVVELGQEAEKLAINAAHSLHREIAGVDIMFGSDNKSMYVLEVNASPQLGSGAFTDEKIETMKNYIVAKIR